MKTLLSLAVAVTIASAQPHAQALLVPEPERKLAPDFQLRDAAGKPGSLKQYRGKVVLLDFWATWCTGCKQEIPWFEEFQRQFGGRLAVVGVSLDEGGWGVLRPFLQQHPIRYRILLGEEATARSYGIEGMPDTFLIDRQGRIAAAYRAALVDRANLEKNINALLAPMRDQGRLIPFEKDGLWGYRSSRGKAVIEPRYRIAQPFSSEGIAAVADDRGWSYIDRTGRVVITPYLYDNGPDYFREGLARFVAEGKIGFFDTRGAIVIPARFDYAEPFEHGRAAVCQGCRNVRQGEHFSWEGGTWSHIDRTGRPVPNLN